MSDFRVQGQLGLDGSGFFSTLGKAEGAVSKMAGVLAGAFSVGAITAFSKSVIDLAGNLNDVSDALGINVEFLQRFLNSAMKSGGNLGDIEKFIFESNRSRQAALNNPTGADAKALQTLGFSREDIAKLNPQQFIEKIIQAFADGATPQEINALADVGGKSAKALVGGFKDGIDEVTAIISEDTILILDELGDRFTMLGITAKSVFAPVLLTIVNFIQRVIDLAQAVYAFYKTAVQTGSLTKGADARDKVLIEQSLRDSRAQNALAERRERRREREAQQPAFEQDVKFGAAKSQSASLYSDSRVAIGGFLGAGKTTNLAAIAERQLQVQTETLGIQKLMLQYARSMTPFGGIIFPP